ncbi:MAG: TonB-dependent receptor [Pseudomonadota bacterium]
MGTNKSKAPFALGGAAALALTGYATPALAQDSSEDAGELRQDVVTVKARKVEEDIQSVPVAVSVFGEEDIFERGITDIDELSKLTPGFVFDTPFGRQFDRPIIRGQANILGDSGVSVFIDGVNVTQSIRSLNFGDVQSIEIIKGPQSALFGRNTYSGAINITSRQPTNEYRGDLRLEGGADGLFQFLGNVSGPIIDDKLFYSLSARYYTFDSEFDIPSNLNPSVGNEQSTTFSGVLRYEPTDNFEMSFRAAYNRDDDGHFPIGLLGFEDLNVNVPGGIDFGGVQPFFQGVVPTSPPNPSGAPQISDTLGEGGGLEREEIFLALNSNYEFAGGYNLFTTLGYTGEQFKDEIDSDGQPTFAGTASVSPPFPAPFIFPGATGVVLLPFDFSTADDDDTETFVAEARIDSPLEDRFRWRLGGYYFNSLERDRSLLAHFTDELQDAVTASGEATIAQVAAALGVPSFTVINLGGGFDNLPIDPQRTLTENVSVFGSVAFDVTDRFTATAELRWARENISQTTFDIDTGAVVVSGTTPLDFEESFTAVTPRFTLDWQATDDNLIYASASRGTKPGGFNGAQGFEFGFGTFDEETLWQYELGSKNYFFDNQLLFNVAGFFSDLSGYQLTENLAALGATSTVGSVTANLGAVDIFGIELDGAFTPAPMPGLTIGGTYAWTDTEFTEGTEGTQEAVFGDGSIVGQELPRQARHQASFFVDYDTQLTETIGALFSVNGTYLSSRFAQVQNLAETGDSFELDARITFSWKDNWSLAVYGKNLTNEDAALGVLRFIDPSPGNGSFVVNGVNIENGFTLSAAGQSRGFQFNNRNGARWGVVARYTF